MKRNKLENISALRIPLILASNHKRVVAKTGQISSFSSSGGRIIGHPPPACYSISFNNRGATGRNLHFITRPSRQLLSSVHFGADCVSPAPSRELLFAASGVFQS